MKLLRRALWTICCIALGIAAATVDIDGRTLVEHGVRAYNRTFKKTPLERLKDSVGDAFDNARSQLFSPKEDLSPQDRASLNAVIAQQSE